MAQTAPERDNLFQLNALIWASFPQPAGAPTTPTLQEARYTLRSVEQPLPSSLVDTAQQKASNLEIVPHPVADVVFEHGESRRLVLTECKPSSFRTPSYNSPQARGLIVAGGSPGGRLGLPGSRAAEACYVVPATSAEEMDETLLALAAEVSHAGLPACPTGAVGLSVRPDGVFLGLGTALAGEAQMPRALIPERRVLAVEPGQDPRPLYVVPWVPDSPDDADQAALREKVRSRVLAWLAKVSPSSGVATLNFEALLDEVSSGVFSKWADKGSLRGKVFPVLGRIVSGLFSSDNRVGIRTNAVSFAVASDADRTELMERARTGQLPSELPSPLQLALEEPQ